MARFPVTITANLAAGKAIPQAVINMFVEKLESGTSLSGDPVGQMMNQWGKRYESDVKRTFTAASRGDGRWKPLATATILRRRSSKGGSRARERQKLIKQTTNGRLDADKRLKAHKRIKELATMAGVAILKNTGALFNALSIGAAGNLLLRRNNRLTFGFSRSATHSKGMSLGMLAAIHDAGNKNLPARQILTPPKPETLRSMAADGIAAILKIMREARP